MLSRFENFIFNEYRNRFTNEPITTEKYYENCANLMLFLLRKVLINSVLFFEPIRLLIFEKTQIKRKNTINTM